MHKIINVHCGQILLPTMGKANNKEFKTTTIDVTIVPLLLILNRCLLKILLLLPAIIINLKELILQKFFVTVNEKFGLHNDYLLVHKINLNLNKN